MQDTIRFMSVLGLGFRSRMTVRATFMVNDLGSA